MASTTESIRGVLKASPAAHRFQWTVAFLIVVVPFAGVIAAVCAWWWGRHVSALDLGLLAAFYCLTIIGITAGFHRYFAHRAFDAPPAVRWGLGILGSMAGQGPLLFWVATHRRHHAFSDRAGDPHSPHVNGAEDTNIWRGLWHAHLGWMFSDEITSWPHFAADHMRDKHAFAINRTYFVWLFLGLALPAAIGGLATGTWAGALGGLLWGGLVRMFLVNHVCWCVGSICHAFGARPFDNRDHSANNYFVALVSFGEGLQNNHHAFPGSANHRVTWWEPDISGWLIQGMKRLGWITAARVPSPEEIQRVRLAGQHPRVGVSA